MQLVLRKRLNVAVLLALAGMLFTTTAATAHVNTVAKGTLIVVTSVTNDNTGLKSASDFTDIVTGTNVLPTSTFAGSASGITVTVDVGKIGPASYSVAQAPAAGYTVSRSADCSGTIAAGETKTCTISDDDKPSPAPVCSMNGLYGVYNNLPNNHPDVEGGVTGVVSGTTPFQFDWFGAKYFSFAATTPIASLNQPANFFPVNDGLADDPFYTAIHWTGFATFPASGTYPFALGSDDDSWFYVNGTLAGSVAGIHAFTQKNFSVTVGAATTTPVDLYFAEREKVQSGLVFQMSGVTFSPCAPVTPTSTPSADIAIAKTANVTSTVEGGAINYTLVVTALGPATSTGVVATDTLPTGLIFANATASQGTYASSTGTWTIGDMPASSTATLSIAATAASGTASTTITNLASVTENASTTDPVTGNNSSTVAVVVATIPPPPSACTLAVSDATNLLSNGSPAALVMTPYNAHWTATIPGATWIWSSPAVVNPSINESSTFTKTFVMTGPIASTTLTINADNGYVAWVNGVQVVNNPNEVNYSASSTAQFDITSLLHVGTNTFMATVTNFGILGSTPQDNPAGLLYRITTNGSCPSIPQADIAIAKTANVTSTVEGGAINYTLVVTALGPATSTGVVATDTLPTGLIFANATASQGTYASSTGTWTIGDMPASSTATLSIAATAASGTASTTITNLASVTENASTTDPVTGNNSSTVLVTVAPNVCTVNCGGGTSADIAIAKTVDNSSPIGGATVNFTVTVTAFGPAASTFVTVNDLLPTGLSVISATTSQGAYNLGTGIWNVGDLAPNATATLVVATLVDPRAAGQTIQNTATVSELASLVDPNPANNSVTVAITVQTPPCTANCGGGGGGGGGGGSTGGGGSAYSIAIDNNASTTATTSATLQLYGTGAYTMELANTPDFASGTWEPYATTHDWTLTPGEGLKTVYVRYRGVGGTDIGNASDTIELVSGGQVLGASTSCGIYLNDYIRLGWANNPNEVVKLQTFLNENLGANLPVSGVYGQADFDAVKQFQIKYSSQVLAPWVPLGLPNDMTPTGFVYQTTRRWVNMIHCAALNLPMPVLQVYHQ